MAAPTPETIIRYAGSNDNGTPTIEDTGVPIGGAINTAVPISSGAVDAVIGFTQITDVDDEFFGIVYFKNTQTGAGRVNSARICNRAAAKLNGSAGTATVVSTANDTGVIRITGKVSGVWDQEDLTLTGTTPAISEKTWDADSVIRWEYLVAGVLTVPTGHLTCMVASELVAVVYGGSDGNTGATREIEIALADAIDTTLESDDRTTAPDDIGSFNTASFWNGEDESIVVPGNELENGHYVGVCIKKIQYGGSPAAVNGVTPWDLALVGNPSAS